MLGFRSYRRLRNAKCEVLLGKLIYIYKIKENNIPLKKETLPKIFNEFHLQNSTLLIPLNPMNASL